MATLRTFLFLLIACTATPIYAFSSTATDNAFAALLSMPGAEPEQGYWDFPIPEDFTPGSESKLIAYLSKQQKAGADFNAYRHFGTLLHHAIRAGKENTALWLLNRGADPQKTAENNNALDLSLRYKLPKLSGVLQDKYGSLLARAGKPAPPPTTPAEIANATEILQYENDYKALKQVIQLHWKDPKTLEKQLAAFPSKVVSRHVSGLLMDIGPKLNSPVRSDAAHTIHYDTPVDSWRTLWRYVEGPIDYGDRREGWAAYIQPELWAELFASGFKNHDAESALGELLMKMNATDFATYWPMVEKHFPNVRTVAPRIVLNPYRVYESRYYEVQEGDLNTTRKLQFLASKGVITPVPDITKRALANASADLLAAVRPYLSFEPRQAKSPQTRLVDATPTCTFAMNATPRARMTCITSLSQFSE